MTSRPFVEGQRAMARDWVDGAWKPVVVDRVAGHTRVRTWCGTWWTCPVDTLRHLDEWPIPTEAS